MKFNLLFGLIMFALCIGGMVASAQDTGKKKDSMQGKIPGLKIDLE